MYLLLKCYCPKKAWFMSRNVGGPKVDLLFHMHGMTIIISCLCRREQPTSSFERGEENFQGSFFGIIHLGGTQLSVDADDWKVELWRHRGGRCQRRRPHSGSRLVRAPLQKEAVAHHVRVFWVDRKRRVVKATRDLDQRHHLSHTTRSKAGNQLCLQFWKVKSPVRYVQIYCCVKSSQTDPIILLFVF